MKTSCGPRQFAAGFQLRLGGSRCEARRDRVGQAIDAVPFRDQVGRFARAGLGRVAQEVRAVAIHQHLAGDHAHVARWLAANSASADAACTVLQTMAVVVPLRSSSSVKKSATARA
jgi:hypothetical protein